MGKNLARMEMRVFLEELTRRLPHMELEPGQTFTYLPNVSFRGPEHLHVRWDPKKNPERATSALRTAGRRFEIGAPRQKDVARTLNVASVHREADDIIRIVLEGPLKQKLPAWSAGAHIDLVFGSFTRTYSLCGALDDPFRYQIAVLKEACGRGGSLHIHDALRPGMTVRVRGPRNHFRLNENADHYSLIAGGIGITPIIAMADRLKALGKAYTLDYCGRSRARMAFLERLQRDHGRHLRLHAAADGQRLDLASLVPKLPASALVYACGPDRLLASLTTLFASKPDHLFTERFSALGSVADASRNRAFEAELADSRLTITVKAEETLLAALNAHGIDVPSDCGEGLCGTCEVAVLAGKIDHRDTVLTAAERREGRRMMACCSRAIGERLVLAL
jgi:ferredoxin-NADP reductase